MLNLRRGLRAALARGRAADPGGPALLLSPGPAASQQGLRLQPAPYPRGAQRLHPAQRAEEACALPAGRRARLTKLGKGFFRDKYYKCLVHVPVIRGAQRAERGGGLRAQGLAAGERAAGTKHPAHLTEEQVAQRVRQQVEALQSTRYRNSRTEVETRRNSFFFCTVLRYKMLLVQGLH